MYRMARAADGRHALPPPGTAGEAASTSIPWQQHSRRRVPTRLRNHNEAQRAPTARPSFVDVSRECAQTSWALIAKTTGFSAESAEGGGLKNRRLR